MHNIFSVNEIVFHFIQNLNKITEISALERIRVEFLGKKGHMTLHLNQLRTLPNEKRRIVGKLINQAKQQLLNAYQVKKKLLEQSKLQVQLSRKTLDISLPGRGIKPGRIHPITSIINTIEKYFCGLGFTLVSGPEVEDTYHNFDALNIPSHHPVRTDHSTFWLNDNNLLRTQMSGLQIRIMKNKQPPIRIISSGRVYRKDSDHTHTPMFHQIEGLMVDKQVSFSHLKKILYDFLMVIFDQKFKIRFRPSYFPFTEPSAEIDIINREGKWLEVLGCGMVHPKVFQTVGIDENIYSGCAFGIGIERLAMLRYDISDVRLFYENHLRFLKQFPEK
ncbi:MAG: phenylalanine--tRNA ligase subunit alpha [Candidatus Dasytiphilus stammeri]